MCVIVASSRNESQLINYFDRWTQGRRGRYEVAPRGDGQAYVGSQTMRYTYELLSTARVIAKNGRVRASFCTCVSE